MSRAAIIKAKLMAMVISDNTQFLISGNKLSARGLISREIVEACLQTNDNKGIRFIYANELIEALAKNLYSTQRNTVIAKNNECVCLTEHFLAACAISGLNNIDLELSEGELPFGDGSAQLWLDFFASQAGLVFDLSQKFKLKQEYKIVDELDNTRFIVLSPADNFSVTYSLDWSHPQIAKQEFTWSKGDPIEAIAKARTFSNESENQMLGLSGWVIGLTEDDITQALHYPDEPARHKALDLLGDLMLSGINPLQIGMNVYSHKAGHELNSRAAKLLNEIYAN